jgi:hypothetical protein
MSVNMRLLCPIFLLCACGNNEAAMTCRVGQMSVYCLDAVAIVARTSESVVLSDIEINDLYSVVREPPIRHPFLRFARADYQSENDPARFTIETSHPSLRAAWRLGEIRTGDSLVDSVFLDNGADTIVSWFDTQGNTIFYVGFVRPLNWRTFNPLVATIPNTIVNDNPQPPSRNNIVILETGPESVRLRYDVGWGDCPSGCIWQHRYEVTVAGSDVMLTDLGGDPIPPEMEAAASQIPPPE